MRLVGLKYVPALEEGTHYADWLSVPVYDAVSDNLAGYVCNYHCSDENASTGLISAGASLYPLEGVPEDTSLPVEWKDGIPGSHWNSATEVFDHLSLKTAGGGNA